MTWTRLAIRAVRLASAGLVYTTVACGHCAVDDRPIDAYAYLDS